MSAGLARGGRTRPHRHRMSIASLQIPLSQGRCRSMHLRSMGGRAWAPGILGRVLHLDWV